MGESALIGGLIACIQLDARALYVVERRCRGVTRAQLCRGERLVDGGAQAHSLMVEVGSDGEVLGARRGKRPFGGVGEHSAELRRVGERKSLAQLLRRIRRSSGSGMRRGHTGEMHGGERDGVAALSGRKRRGRHGVR